jgi:hypothetical protein
VVKKGYQMEDSKNKTKKISLSGTKIKAVPKKPVEVGIDTTKNLEQNILNAAINGVLDISKLEGFSTVSQTRESIYKILDSMGNDSMISSILETYAEDTVEPNDKGRIMWCESSDANVSKYVTYLLDSMNVDKHLYGWAYSLIKYGDLYLRLYKESDYENDLLFGTTVNEKQKILNEQFNNLGADDEHMALSNFMKQENKKEKNDLKEDVNIITHKDGDHYVHYIEAVANPGDMFELTKFGKTMGYIEAPVKIQSVKQNSLTNLYMPVRYEMKRGDVNIFQPTDFVHAALEDTSSRQPEEVQIFLDGDEKGTNLKYTVRRGQSLLYSAFKIWRELSLLESSVLLNRITKSSIVRVISVEVGDMPKENVGVHLASIKSLVEQKSAVNTGVSMQEYTNPGPVENNIYVPTHGGIGAISTQQIGGDVDPKKLTDLSYFQDKFFGSFRTPKQFFGVTDDSTGFNGGSSLSIISSRYGKAIKRIQNTLIQALTDVVNLMLLDKGLTAYINKFTLRMSAPITQEEIDKRESMTNQIRVVTDIVNLLSDISNPARKLKIINRFLSTTVSDSEIVQLIQEEIDELEKEENKPEKKRNDEVEEPDAEDVNTSFENKVFGDTDNSEQDLSTSDELDSNEQESEESEESGESEESEEMIDTESDYLPKPSDLGIDFTQNK